MDPTNRDISGLHCTKFQIDISKHVEEKSGKRGRTDGRTDIATA